LESEPELPSTEQPASDKKASLRSTSPRRIDGTGFAR